MNCLVPGCKNDARNKLAVRCRKPSTRAVWAPDSEAYLCKAHAEGGVKIEVSLQPTSSGTVEVTYSSGGRQAPPRTTPINRRAA